MSWNHLYSRGAVEDQDPTLLAYFDILHREKNRAERIRQEKAQKEQEAKAQSMKNRRGMAGRK